MSMPCKNLALSVRELSVEAGNACCLRFEIHPGIRRTHEH
jgi:hypothetical protein